MAQRPALLPPSLVKNQQLHQLINREIQLTPYGQITINVQLKSGVAQLSTLSLVKTRRTKYKSIDKTG